MKNYWLDLAKKREENAKMRRYMIDQLDKYIVPPSKKVKDLFKDAIIIYTLPRK